ILFVLTRFKHSPIVQRGSIIRRESERVIVHNLGQERFSRAPEQVSVIDPSRYVRGVFFKSCANLCQRSFSAVRSPIRCNSRQTEFAANALRAPWEARS